MLNESPTQTASSASCTCNAFLSTVLKTATVAIPSSLQLLTIRKAISPRLAIKTFSTIIEI